MSTIASDACGAPLDYGLMDTLEYIWILLDIRSSTHDSCNKARAQGRVPMQILNPYDDPYLPIKFAPNILGETSCIYVIEFTRFLTSKAVLKPVSR
ncbi:hypothetical protein TNCV_2868381 [Trichonephila clavipes]|nr:hypothetical protein TNCV_2868381 [Trichonephila clavipes]